MSHNDILATTDSDPSFNRSPSTSNGNTFLSTPISIPSSPSSRTQRRPSAQSISAVSTSSSANSISGKSARTGSSGKKLGLGSPPATPNAPRSSSRSRILASSDKAARDYEINEMMRMEKEKERERERETQRRMTPDSNLANQEPDALTGENDRESMSSKDGFPRSFSSSSIFSGSRPPFNRTNTNSSNNSGKGGVGSSTIRRPSSSSGSSMPSSSPGINRANTSAGFFDRANTTSPTIPEGFKDYSRRAKSPPIVSTNTQSPNLANASNASLGLGLSNSSPSSSTFNRSPYPTHRERSFSSRSDQILEDVSTDEKPRDEFGSPSTISTADASLHSPVPASLSSPNNSVQSPAQLQSSRSLLPSPQSATPASPSASPTMSSSATATSSKQSLRSRLFGKKKKEEINPGLTSLQISKSNSSQPASPNPASSSVSIASEDGTMINSHTASQLPTSSSMEKSKSFAGPKSAPANTGDFYSQDASPPPPLPVTSSSPIGVEVPVNTGERVASLSKRFGPLRTKSKNGKGKGKEDGSTTATAAGTPCSPTTAQSAEVSSIPNSAPKPSTSDPRHELDAAFPISTSSSSFSNKNAPSGFGSNRPSTGTSVSTVSSTKTSSATHKNKDYLSSNPNSSDLNYHSYPANRLKSTSQVSLTGESTKTIDGRKIGSRRESKDKGKERTTRSNISHGMKRSSKASAISKEKERQEAQVAGASGGLRRRSSWPPAGGVNGSSFVTVKGGDPGSTTAGYRFHNAASGRSPVSPNFSVDADSPKRDSESRKIDKGLASPIAIGTEPSNYQQQGRGSIPPRPARSPPALPTSYSNPSSPRKKSAKARSSDRPFSSSGDDGRPSSQILTVPSKGQRPRSYTNGSGVSSTSNLSDAAPSSPPLSSSTSAERTAPSLSSMSPTSSRSTYTMAASAPPTTTNSYFPLGITSEGDGSEGNPMTAPSERPRTADHHRTGSYSSPYGRSPSNSALSSPNRNITGLPSLNVIPRSSSLVGHGGTDLMSLSNATNSSLGLPSPPPRVSSTRDYSDLIASNLDANQSQDQEKSSVALSPTTSTTQSGVSPTTSAFSALRAKFGAAISAPLSTASQSIAAVTSGGSGLISPSAIKNFNEVKAEDKSRDFEEHRLNKDDAEAHKAKDLETISSRNQSQSSLNSTSHSEASSLGRILDGAPLTPMNRSAVSLVGSDGGQKEVLNEPSQVGKNSSARHLAPPKQAPIGLGSPTLNENSITPKLKTPSKLTSNHDGDLSSAFGSPASFHTPLTHQPRDESITSSAGRLDTPKERDSDFLGPPTEDGKGGAMPLLPPKSPLRYRKGQEIRHPSVSSQDSMLRPTRISSDPFGLTSLSSSSTLNATSARDGLGIDSLGADILEKSTMKEPVTPSSIISTTSKDTDSDFGLQDLNDRSQNLEVGDDLERVSATSGAFEGMDVPPWSDGKSPLPPVPASAKRTVSASAIQAASTSKVPPSAWISNDDGIKSEYELTKSLSRNSQVNLDESNSPSSTKREFTSSTIGKRTPSIAKTWGKARKSSKGKAIENLEIEEEGNPIPPDSSNAGSTSTHTNHTASKRKSSRKWPFSKEVFSDAEDESKDEKKMTSSKSSSAFSLRSKKVEAPVRPQIRRVFDPPIDTEDDTAAPSRTGGNHDQLQEMMSRNPTLSQQASLPSLRTRASIESQKSKGQFSEPGQSPAQGHQAMGSPSFSVASGSEKGVRRPTSSHGVDSRYPMGSPASAAGNGRLTELSPEQKRLIKRRNIIRELVETEKSYASDLAVIRDVYLMRARSKAGISNITSLSNSNSLAGTPTGNSTPGIPSPSINQPGSSSSSFFPPRFPSSLGSNGSTAPSTPSGPPSTIQSRHGQRQPSAESGPSLNFNALNSPSLLASASTTSNRSSVYTVSSQSSQTSDSNNAVKSTSKPNPSQSIGVNPSASKQPVSLQTQSPSSGSILQSGQGHVEAPLTPSDIRMIFAGLEQCAAFADEMAVQLELSMGGYSAAELSEKGWTNRSNSIPRNVRSRNRTSSGGRILNEEEELKEQDDDSIGETFLRQMPRIEQVYTAYCSRHEASMLRLQEVTAGSAKVAAFMRDCNDAARKQTNAWDLSSLLIKPVQRVLKYPLLIQEIISTTLPSHPDFESLKAAQAEIQRAAETINEVKRRRDAVLDSISSASKGGPGPKTPSSKNLKRKGESGKGKVPLSSGTGSDPKADNYHQLASQVRELEGKVSALSQHLVEWVDQVRRTNKAQRRLLSQWRATYRASEAEPAAEERLHALSSVLRMQIDGPWQQLDSDLRSSIMPMLARLGLMFQNPKAVMAKRDIRESDYSKYRSTLNKSDKTPDRKLLESANAFVALHAQLLDELPQFIYGVQTLLDIGVESLAKAQALYFLSVKRGLVHYWKENGWGNESDITVDEITQEPSMKSTNPVKQFWEAHREISGYAETLAICAPSGEDDEGSPSRSRFVSSENASTSNLGHGVDDDQSSLHPENTATRSHTSSSRLGVATSGLVRSLSGNRSANSSLVNLIAGGDASEKDIKNSKFEEVDREDEDDDQPPSPPVKDIPIQPPSLPQLEFKSGFFIVEGSPQELPFLLESSGQPYDLSPSISTKELPNIDDSGHSRAGSASGSMSNSRSNQALSASSSASNNTATQGSGNFASNSIGDNKDDLTQVSKHSRQRTQFKVVRVSAAVADSPKRDGSSRFGWPYLEYSVGDMLYLLSHDMEKSGYLFGRIEAGEMGWAESDRFKDLEI